MFSGFRAREKLFHDHSMNTTSYNNQHYRQNLDSAFINEFLGPFLQVCLSGRDGIPQSPLGQTILTGGSRA